MTRSPARRTARQLYLAIGSCLVMLMAAPQAAAEPDAGDAAKRAAISARADQLAREGAAAAAHGDLAGARSKLADAFALKPAYDIAGNLGGVEYGLGKYRDAARHLAFSLRVYATTGNEEHRAQTEDFLSKASAKLCTVALQGLPSDGGLEVDGSDLELAPIDREPTELTHIYLEPGEHTLSLSAPGHLPARKRYTCMAGTSGVVPIQLKRAPGAPQSQAEQTAIGVPLWPVAVGSSLAFAALGVGTGMWFAKQDLSDSADALLISATQNGSASAQACNGTAPSPTCAAVHKAREREANFENASIAAFITGGAATVATLSYLIGYSVAASPDAGDTAARIHFTPGGMTLSGSF